MSLPLRITDELDALEVQIKRLHIEWEKFFGGVEKKPPNDMRMKVESLIRRHSLGEIRNNGDRFRYQTITARYATFNELWNKRLRAMEEGRPVGHGPRHGLARPPAPQPVAAAAAETPAARPAAAAAPKPNGEFRVRDTDADAQSVRALFEQFLDARNKAGETAPVKYESFQKIIGQQAARILAEKGALAVDFRLETRDGKVSLKAKPVR